MRSGGAIFTTAASSLPIPFIIGSAFLVYDRADFDTYRIAGMVLALVGFSMLTIARLRLGDSFSIAPEAKQLVTTGIYAKVRHPVYVFGLIAIAGLFLYVHLFPALLVFLLLIPMQYKRARAEEKVLTAKFGDSYTAYKAGTWF
jgi:protein-S-isoprenylcysteine O-methyltransferase Ste14